MIKMEAVALGKHLPDYTDEEVWKWFGARGVYSQSPQQFKLCFDVFEHKQGKLTYRLKHTKDQVKLKSEDNKNLFDSIVIHDPMETLYLREYGDEINVINTHYRSGKEREKKLK